MLEQDEFHLSFGISVHGLTHRTTANLAVIKTVEVKRYQIGKLLTQSTTNDEIKPVLKQHNCKLGGRKEALLERLTQLCVQQYSEHEEELTAYFSRNRFIRISDDSTQNLYKMNYEADKHPIEYATFPLLEDHLLRNQLLAMFVMRHMRGNVIVDGTYLNATCTLHELAKGLIQEVITLQKTFLRVG
jgi:hypothetical protein